jgi:hypothetical protein
MTEVHHGAETFEHAGRSGNARHDLFSALVLAAATVLTAWCAFQAAAFLTSSEASRSSATKQRIESTKLSNQAAAFSEIDANLWSEWVRSVLDERAAGDLRSFAADGSYTPVEGTKSAFYYRSFRREMRPAFEAWIATRPFDGGDGPAVPFVLPQYVLDSDEQADVRAAASDEDAAASEEDADTALDYVLLGAVSAAGLAVAGLATRFQNARVRAAMIVFSALVIGSVLVGALVLPTDV